MPAGPAFNSAAVCAPETEDERFARIAVATVAGSVVAVHDALKYAVVERERRFLVAKVPEGVVDVRQIIDHYLEGTRLRLREMTDSDGAVIRKLGHKVRLTSGPGQVAGTSVYLDDREWGLLRALPARTLRKTRHIVERDGFRLLSTNSPTGRSWPK